MDFEKLENEKSLTKDQLIEKHINELNDMKQAIRDNLLEVGVSINETEMFAIVQAIMNSDYMSKESLIRWIKIDSLLDNDASELIEKYIKE